MTITAFVVTTTFITLGLYDLFMCCVYGTDASVSRFMQNSGVTNPFIILCIGYCLGHFWGKLRSRTYDIVADLDEFQQIVNESTNGHNLGSKRTKTKAEVYELIKELRKCR